jgi:dihydropteroate synthase
MHNKNKAEYVDVVDEVRQYLERSVDVAVKAGISRDRIIVDPGIGFGKTHEHNLQLLASLDKLRSLGRPILLGASRKSFIGRILELPPADRIEGTIAASVLGASMGADIVRVHDVKATVRALRVTDAILAYRNGKEGLKCITPIR